jgi:hypothetical protein
MPRLDEVCRYVRSKNAGPFWVTIDLFFDGPESFARYADDPALSAEALAKLYGVEPASVRRFKVEDLDVVKISIPRGQPQGGVLERDMHSGQQFVPMLSLELGG